jgi:glycosyltransferase involved in cell wall biosynthesis
MIRTIALICTHNGDRYLREQIDSLLSQTCLLDKIYIFDFNSKDNTVVVSKEVLCENENVHLEVFDFAPGPALSFFIGIDSIRRAEVEDYLLYLVDQDDVWLETKNSFILNEYDKLHFDFAFHDVKVVDVDLKVLRSNYYGRYWNVERDFNYPSQLF